MSRPLEAAGSWVPPFNWANKQSHRIRQGKRSILVIMRIPKCHLAGKAKEYSASHEEHISGFGARRLKVEELHHDPPPTPLPPHSCTKHLARLRGHAEYRVRTRQSLHTSNIIKNMMKKNKRFPCSETHTLSQAASEEQFFPFS